MACRRSAVRTRYSPFLVPKRSNPLDFGCKVESTLHLPFVREKTTIGLLSSTKRGLGHGYFSRPVRITILKVCTLKVYLLAAIEQVMATQGATALLRRTCCLSLKIYSGIPLHRISLVNGMMKGRQQQS